MDAWGGESGDARVSCSSFSTSILSSLEPNFCAGLGRDANEGPVRTQYKCLVPIFLFPEMKLLFPKYNYNVLSPSSYTHIYERFIYFQDRSTYSAAGKYVDQFWEYINGSQTHECGNWD
jgi:hypothetical protein